MPPDEEKFIEELRPYYHSMRKLNDGRWIGVHRLLYHWTLHIDISPWGYEDRYCYPNLEDAQKALEVWDGTGDPPSGWVRHPKTARRRDLKTGREWIAE